MKRRILVALVVAVACTAGAAMAARFTWTAGGSSDAWGNCFNWDVTGIPAFCSPNTTADDATIPFAGGGYTVDLTTTTIDDLTIEGDVDFGHPTATPKLEVDSLTINGPAVVTIGDGARIGG